MSVLSAEFEFEIGDFVYFKSVLLGGGHPRAYTVVGRKIEQCHGGTQSHVFLDEIGQWIACMSLAKFVSLAASTEDVG